MKRRRHTPEQIIRKLREADRMLSEGWLEGRREGKLDEPVAPTLCGPDASGPQGSLGAAGIPDRWSASVNSAPQVVCWRR
jgi:hypothetical protein